MASSKPLLSEEVDLEAGPSEEAPAAASGSKKEAAPKQLEVLRLSLFEGIKIWFRDHNLPSTPGYARSVYSRLSLRALTLFAILLTSVIEEGTSNGFDYWVVKHHLLACGLTLFAGFGPRFMHPSNVPDVILGLVAAENTWRSAWHIVGTSNEGTPAWELREAVCSEHLAMFWIVVLPIMCCGETLALGAYGLSLLLLYALTGVPGGPCLLIAAIMLVPVYVAERIWCAAYDEIVRGRLAITSLLKGTGGASFTVDLNTGCLVEVSPGMTAFTGRLKEGAAITELVRLPKDKETLNTLLRACLMACDAQMSVTSSYTVYQWREYLKLMDESVEAAIKPRKVMSLRCMLFKKGVKAKIVPYNLDMPQKLLSVWVEAGNVKKKDPRFKFAKQEQVYAAREHHWKEKQHALETKEKELQELETSLKELHGNYLQGLAEQQYLVTKHREVLGVKGVPEAALQDGESFYDKLLRDLRSLPQA